MVSDTEYMTEIERLNTNLQKSELARTQTENQYSQMSNYNVKGDPNMMEYQLELKQDLDMIYHLLSGHELGINTDGNEIWQEPTDDRLKIFSDYGVKQVMNVISFYVNKNTLLSYYPEDTINWKMKDFGEELADLIYNRYEHFFFYPKPEELYDLAKPTVKKLGMDMTDDELYYKCVSWSEDELQQRLRHYPIIILAIIDLVHSTYMRAYGGKERESMRKSVNIHESTNPGQLPQQPTTKFSAVKPSTW